MSGFEKLIYIIRDPRDILVSLSNYAFTPYRLKYFPHNEKNPETYIKNRLGNCAFDWLNHVCHYLKHGKQLSIYFVFYERLLSNFNIELKRMLNHLGVSLSEKAIEEIKREVSFETMKKQNKDHLRKGTYGQWVDVLTDAQVKQISELTGPLLKFLGYALTKKEQLSSPLPQLPKEYNSRTIDQILAQGNRAYQILKAKRLVGKIRTKIRAKGIPV